jgi:predicted lipoprotein with Yx(FWY)xxD motif
MKKYTSASLGLFLVIGMFAMAWANQPAVKIADKDGVGRYLTDADGMTLYWFTKDSSGKSVCNGGCLEKWPVYYSESVAPPMGVDAKDFGTITRADGKTQTTFRGYPLYYFFKDGKPGDTAGQGVKGVWYVIDPRMFPPK